MSLIVQILLFFLISSSFWLIINHLLISKPTSSTHTPPTPSALPIIGHLHHLGPSLHRSIFQLSNKLGPIILLRFGSVSNVFISSSTLVEEVLKTNDIVFANRPLSEATEFLTYNYKGFSFAEYGPYWRSMRKFFVTRLMSPVKLKATASIRAEELAIFINTIKQASEDGVVIDVTKQIQSVVADIMCRIVMGRKCMDESVNGGKLSEHIIEVMTLLGSFNIGDYVKFLKPFDLQGYRKRMKAVKAPLDRFLDKAIDEHIEARKGRRVMELNEDRADYIDHILDAMESNDGEYQFNRTTIKAAIMDILEGSDVLGYVTEWALVELLRNKRVMTKLQEELKSVVGINRMVDENDLVKLSYLENVVKETLRLHFITPFLPHHNKEDCNIGGFTIPRESNVFLCTWAMARDPNVWHDAEEFIPERFKDSDLDVKGHNFQLLPFGFGRRGCAGQPLALILVPLLLANIVQCFNWQLPSGMTPEKLDMNEKYGLILARATHLFATPNYQLKEK